MGTLDFLPGVNNVLNNHYAQVEVRFDAEQGALWTYLKADGVPTYTPSFLSDIGSHHKDIEKSCGMVHANEALHRIRYSIVASRTPGAFNLGGNLALFVKLIRERDYDGLLDYGTACINVMWPRMNHFNLPLTTISLVQGDALGGGLESALASDVIVAEKGAKMGFPEILFNLFPGMGAYSMAARKIGPADTEKMILSGNIYTAEELFELGLVDVLAEDGEGEKAVHEYMKKQSRSYNGYQAVHRVRNRVNPVTREELIDVVTIWAEAAMQLGEKDLRVMERLVRTQQKHYGEAKQEEEAAFTL
jgi:DSF synthase